MDLVAALEARTGVTCAVGAGGKKSALFALADRLDRAVLTATVPFARLAERASRVVVAEDPAAAVADAAPGDFPLGVVPGRYGEDRYAGYDPGRVDDLAAAHDGPVLVKADGARGRKLKAPEDGEPPLPDAADTVLPVASLAAVDRPLEEGHVHRVERVAALTGLDRGATVTPEAVATVLAHDRGGLKGVGDATAVPVVNKVDGVARHSTARAVAVGVHSRADVPRVALTSLRSADPLVATV